MKINPNFKKVALRAVKEASTVLRKKFKKQIQISSKKDRSLVTDVDLKAEKAIIKLIKKNFPSHSILSEEIGGKIGEKYTWVIDSLDGTTNYTRSIPFFSISIALLCQRNPILGVVFNPINKELYFAEKGKGAFLNGKRLKGGQQKILSKAIISFNKYRAKEDFKKLHRIIGITGGKCATFRILGSVALALCYLAAGKVDALFGIGNSPWDFAAGALIIKEAGGKVTNLEGKDWQINEKNIIAANEKIHNQLLKLIKSK